MANRKTSFFVWMLDIVNYSALINRKEESFYNELSKSVEDSTKRFGSIYQSFQQYW